MRIKTPSQIMGLAFTGIVSMALVDGFSEAVQAATITTLFNTGVNATGNPLPDGTIGDPHYTLTSVPAGSSTNIIVSTLAGGYPIPPWIGDNNLSAWISPHNPNSGNSNEGPPGSYTYRTTFDLTGFIPNTAKISGEWSTDNDGLFILLNGVNTGIPGTSDTQFSQGFVSFSINSGFVSGINTLDFIVNNSGFGGPTGLRTQLTGTAEPVPPEFPEPSSLLGLAAITILGVGTISKRKLLQNRK